MKTVDSVEGFKDLLKKETKTKSTRFCGTNVRVKQLTVSQVKDFQEKIENANAVDDDGNVDAEAGLAVQRDLIRMAIVGADELNDEELDSFPLTEVSNLCDAIMKESGISVGKQEAGNPTPSATKS